MIREEGAHAYDKRGIERPIDGYTRRIIADQIEDTSKSIANGLSASTRKRVASARRVARRSATVN